MKSSLRFPPACALLALGLPMYAAAATATVGGYVPEKRNLTVTPVYDAAPSDAYRTKEVATIRIDNNLPNYSLVLDFSDRDGSRDVVSEVRLEPVQGTLGRGLTAPGAAALAPEDGSGRFVWYPGTQESATLDYEVRVYVTYKRPLESQPLLTVGMPSSM